MGSRGGFRLTDLLVAIIIFLILFLGLAFPTVHGVRDYAWFELCAANLKTIGQAMLMYAEANHGQFPRTRWDPNSSAVNFYTSPTATDPFASDGPLPNDVTASLFLLVRTQDLPPEIFLCPLTSLQVAPSARTSWATRSNFVGPTELGYSMANPFPSQAAVKSGFHWDNKLTSEDPVLADMNPGSVALSVNWNSPASAIASANSRNHRGGVGQMVLFGDGHADRVQTPFAGKGGDNIYTYGPATPTSGGTGVVGLPTSADDAVLLPVATIDPGARIDPWTIARRTDLTWDGIFYGILGGITICASILFGRTRVAKWIWKNIFATGSIRRLRKGLCVKCGYNLRETPNRCPECGTIPKNQVG